MVKMFPLPGMWRLPYQGILPVHRPLHKALELNCLRALDGNPSLPVRCLPMGARSRKWLLFGLSAALLAFLLYRSRHLLNLGDFSGQKLWLIVKGANHLYILFSILLIYVCYFLRALRWRNFQKYLGHSRLWHIYEMTLAGFSAIFLLGRAGEPVRPLLISRKDNVPLADTFGIYALERLFDTASTAILAAIGLLIFTGQQRDHSGQAATTFETAAKTAGTVLRLGVLVAVVLPVIFASMAPRSWSDACKAGWRPTVGAEA